MNSVTRRLLSNCSSSTRSPINIYKSHIQTGHLRPDPYQTKIINQLDTLYHSLKNYKPPPPTKTTNPFHIFRNLFAATHHHDSLPPIPSDSPRGIYLYGTVGTGKSMLMDLFYDSIKNLNQQDSRQNLPVKRIHFHQFMVDIHQKNHQLQLNDHNNKVNGGGGVTGGHADVLVSIAYSISQECKVLCFDEFQVTDIVDAMILKRLLEALLSYGVVIVITSNRHPDELYKNGIQRESFLGCIKLIKEEMKVIDLNSGHDYRSENLINQQEEEQETSKNKKNKDMSRRVFIHPNTEENIEIFKQRFKKITKFIDPKEEIIKENRELSIWGTRSILVPISTSHVAWFDFNILCNTPPLSAADYLKIVQKFNVIFINNVPSLSIHQRDIARRFILFIDAAYESKTNLMTLSEVPITDIFSTRDELNSLDGGEEMITSDMRATVDDLGIDSKTIGTSSLFSGEEERFAWARAVSRLNEMNSNRWPSYSLLTHLIDNPDSDSASSSSSSSSLNKHHPITHLSLDTHDKNSNHLSFVHLSPNTSSSSDPSDSSHP